MTIMHKNCMDVAFEVVHNHWRKFGSKYKLKGYWINLGYMGQPFRLTGLKTITIKEQDRANWINITDQVNQVRYKPGPPRLP